MIRFSYALFAGVLMLGTGMVAQPAYSHDHDAGIADGTPGDPDSRGSAPNAGGSPISQESRGGQRGSVASAAGRDNSGGKANSDGGGGVADRGYDPPGLRR